MQDLRPDFERLRALKNEPRSAERLAVHYAIETRLAKRLAESTQAERATLYAEAYRQLFDLVDDHPQRRAGTAARADRIRAQVAFLRRWLAPGATYVEIGCGDAVLTKAIAPFVAASIGVDVTPVLVDAVAAPPSFRFVRTAGAALDLLSSSVDLVYSNQLMEHLHVDDANLQLAEVFRVLKPGGRYICVTPNRLTGPHDISGYFGYAPTGLHLREYDHRSLGRLFRRAGFATVTALVTLKGRTLRLPVGPLAVAEAALDVLPRALRTRIALNRVVANGLGVTLMGTK